MGSMNPFLETINLQTNRKTFLKTVKGNKTIVDNSIGVVYVLEQLINN